MAPLVLGILSLLLPIVGLVLGAIAISLGRKARQELAPGSSGHSMATAGWIMGIVAVVVWSLALVLLLVNLAWFVPFVHSVVVHGVYEGAEDSIWFATAMSAL